MKNIIGLIIVMLMFVVVSIITASTLSAPQEKSSSVTVTAVGDVMLDRYIKNKAEKNDWRNIAKDFRKDFGRSDILIGNLESPITNLSSVSNVPTDHPDNMRFTAPPESLEFLTNTGFDLVSIGNNHIYDFGVNGVIQTEKYLRQAGILYVGTPSEKPGVETIERNGVNVSFVSYNQFLPPEYKEIVETIQTQRETTDWVIVLAHWGEEYELLESAIQRELAMGFIDAGADIIIGTHPHVIQPKQEYNGGVIYYSLGNFVFDQYWHPAVSCGLVLSIELSKSEIKEISTTTALMTETGETKNQDCQTKDYQSPIL